MSSCNPGLPHHTMPASKTSALMGASPLRVSNLNISKNNIKRASKQAM